jgi:hypothetical protein
MPALPISECSINLTCTAAGWMDGCNKLRARTTCTLVSWFDLMVEQLIRFAGSSLID